MVEPAIVIVGAGPAGVRAAQAAVEAGLRPIVIDEGARDGGQIYRRQPEGFTRLHAGLYGTEADRAAALHSCFDGLRDRVDYRPNTLVWNIADGAVRTHGPSGHETISYASLILCTGATDRLVPVEGWHRAGTYSLGAAQVALKGQACAIGRRVVFMGTGPLLYLVAAQYVKAGAEVAAVLDTSRFRDRLAALPLMLSQPDIMWNGVTLLRDLRRARVPVIMGITPLEVMGDPDAGVSGICYRAADGTVQEIACDAVAMGYHLRAETQLADLAGCTFSYDRAFRQWLPQRDANGRSSQPAIYLAGDGARILGARAAEASGRLAMLTALGDLGERQSSWEDGELRRAIAGYDRFARGLARAFPWPAHFAAELEDRTIVCRCESITAGEIRRVVREEEACEANRAKAFSRLGMGRCQGRYCGLAGAELIAASAGLPVEQVGRLRGQAPVKPLCIGTAGSAA